jgi:hypothetical protein
VPSKKKAKSNRLIHFKDNKGRIVKLDAKLTMDDLVKMGISLKLTPNTGPVPDGWYANPI